MNHHLVLGALAAVDGNGVTHGGLGLVGAQPYRRAVRPHAVVQVILLVHAVLEMNVDKGNGFTNSGYLKGIPS